MLTSIEFELWKALPLMGVLGALEEKAPNGQARMSQAKGLYITKQRTDSDPNADLSSVAPPPPMPLPGEKSENADIWSWTAPGDNLAVVKDITCRVFSNGFRVGKVLDSVEFGHAASSSPTDFTHKVAIVFKQRTVLLPLSPKFHYISYKTTQGRITNKIQDPLWRLPSKHDTSLVRVFVYDFDPTITVDDDAISAITDPGGLDAPEAVKLLERNIELQSKTPTADDGLLFNFLFRDKLWSDSDSTQSGTSSSARVKVPGARDLSLGPMRIIVICSLTACKDRDDFQPGGLGGVARLYPHILVKASAPLDEVRAAVRFTRPQVSHMGHNQANADPRDIMLHDMGTLLVADSNADGLMMDSVPVLGFPFVYWSSLFNYYVVEPTDKKQRLKDKALHIVVSSRFDDENKMHVTPKDVRHDKHPSRDLFHAIERDVDDVNGKRFRLGLAQTAPAVLQLLSNPENGDLVKKLPHQGAFDNIHMAPRMKVGDRITRISAHGIVQDFDSSDPKELHGAQMDEIVMAPFCPHDCFHMHWRWADHDNNTDGASGFDSGGTAHKVPGATMVPKNQDVFLVCHEPHSFSYLAMARGLMKDGSAQELPANSWQVFWHHGTAYGLSVNKKVMTAREVHQQLVEVEPQEKIASFKVGNFEIPIHAAVQGGFALFYWHLRFTFETEDVVVTPGLTKKVLKLKERFRFIDQDAVLKF